MGDEPNPMKPASPEQAVFAEALQRTTPEARAAYLDAACGTDTALRRRVEVLLRAAENAGDFLEDPPMGLSGDTDSTLPVSELSENPGDRIGRYKLLEKIGEGGCGVVYMAEQEEPVRRRVALKVIKLGMDTRQVIARFEAERQALALMDHPNIAKVLDGGATQSGRPYFVMELVRGVRITEFCDEARLSTEVRLRLFVLVCQAVQHAHQKGIIHRDLKPSNILVTVNDGAPVPKVIDFGIAKATGQRLTDKTMFTQFHSFIGTPAYTSPEQAEMSSVDIDTRSDIYSLGVLLYELLIGRTPFDGEELLRSGLDEMRRILRETEPLRPSTRLGTLSANELTTSARRRQTEPPKLIHLVRGDLDWIVMKALEKDRTRRYETASGLAGDVQRHLDNEPVSARPPSAAYRFQKLVRRNKVAVAAGTAVALTLVFGVVASTWQAVRATKAEQAAMFEGKRAEQQAQLAAQEAARATAVATAARRYAYAAEINVALQALAENNLSKARELLERQQPKAGEEDLRGFEWRYLWQLCEGNELATFRDDGGHGAAFSPDGKLFAYSGGKITVRETVSRKIVATLPSPATTLSFASNTNLLASGHDTGVKLWDTETWQEVRSLPDTMHPALFSPDGRWLLTGVAEGFRVWDSQTWQPMGLCAGAPPLRWHSRNAVAFSPDGQFLVTIASEVKAAGDYLRVWRLPGLEALPDLRFTNEGPGSVAFSSDGKHIIAGLYDGHLVVWDFATRQVVAKRKEHTAWITAIRVTPDGKTFVTASTDMTINLWDAATFEPFARRRGHVGEVWSVAISPDGRTVVSGSAEGTTKLWNSEARPTETVLDGYFFPAGFLGGGRQLVAAKSEGWCVWAPESGARVDFSIPTTPPLFSSEEGKFTSVEAKPDVHPKEPLGARGRNDGTIELWHLTTGAKVTAWPAHKDALGVVAFSPDGKWLATGTIKGEITIWEFATRRDVMRLGPVGCKLLCLAFSPDGKTVAASGESSRVWLWEAATGREVVQLPGNGTLVASVAFSPDGALLATASLGNGARLWDLPSGKPRTTLRGHLPGVFAVAFSPDGKTLVTGGMDRKVILWDVATHQELAAFPLGGLFPTLAFSPDGRTLAIGNLHEDGRRIQILRAPSFEEIAAAGAKPRDAVNP
jgi:eukaryotic-like serine/threonine-protein kinase